MIRIAYRDTDSGQEGLITLTPNEANPERVTVAIKFEPGLGPNTPDPFGFLEKFIRILDPEEGEDDDMRVEEINGEPVDGQGSDDGARPEGRAGERAGGSGVGGSNEAPARSDPPGPGVRGYNHNTTKLVLPDFFDSDVEYNGD